MAVDDENHKDTYDINPHTLDYAYAHDEFIDQEALIETKRIALLEALSQSGVAEDELIGQYFEVIHQFNDYRRILLLDEALRLRPRLQVGEPIIPTTSNLDLDVIVQPEGDGASVAQPLIDEERHILAWRVQTTGHPEGVVVDDTTIIGHEGIMAYLDAESDRYQTS